MEVTRMTEPQPQIGMGATLCRADGSYPFAITRVTSRTIGVQRLLQVSLQTGHRPVRTEPDVAWDHTYTAQEIEKYRPRNSRTWLTAYRRADGRYYLKGTPMIIGTATLKVDYADLADTYRTYQEQVQARQANDRWQDREEATRG